MTADDARLWPVALIPGFYRYLTIRMGDGPRDGHIPTCRSR